MSDHVRAPQLTLPLLAFVGLVLLLGMLIMVWAMNGSSTHEDFSADRGRESMALSRLDTANPCLSLPERLPQDLPLPEGPILGINSGSISLAVAADIQECGDWYTWQLQESGWSVDDAYVGPGGTGNIVARKDGMEAVCTLGHYIFPNRDPGTDVQVRFSPVGN